MGRGRAAFIFPFSSPANPFRVPFTFALPHYLRAWNTLVSILTSYLAFTESREMTEQRQRQTLYVHLEVSVK